MHISTSLLSLIVVAGIAAIVIALVALRTRGAASRDRVCARCAAAALYGYSQKAESARKDIVPLCLNCLLTQLEQDYSAFAGRAVVIQPVADLPCYVFRDREYLQWLSTESPEMDREVHDLLSKIGQCKRCGSVAHCEWVESRGLNEKTFEALLQLGIVKTLLAWGNPAPISLCGKCLVRQISQSVRGEGFSHIEVSSPHGTDEGIVLPMGY
jgi:hypothetical protein